MVSKTFVCHFNEMLQPYKNNFLDVNTDLRGIFGTLIIQIIQTMMWQWLISCNAKWITCGKMCSQAWAVIKAWVTGSIWYATKTNEHSLLMWAADISVDNDKRLVTAGIAGKFTGSVLGSGKKRNSPLGRWRSQLWQKLLTGEMQRTNNVLMWFLSWKIHLRGAIQLIQQQQHHPHPTHRERMIHNTAWQL